MEVLQAAIPLQVAQILHYVSPLLIFLYFVGANAWSLCNLQTSHRSVSPRLRQIVAGLMLALVVEFLAQAVLIIVEIFTHHGIFAAKDRNVYAMSGAILWSVVAASLLASQPQHPWYPYYGACILGWIADVTASGLVAGSTHSIHGLQWSQVALSIVRILTFTALLVLFVLIHQRGYVVSMAEGETAPLLPLADDSSALGTEQANNYGSTATTAGQDGANDDNDDDNEGSDNDEEEGEDEREKQIKRQLAGIQDRLKKEGSWLKYMWGFSIFVPYIWPTRRPLLQLKLLGVGICVVAGRVLNILQPRQLGLITNALIARDGPATINAVGILFLLNWLGSAAGFAGLRRWLWVPVESNANYCLDVAAYSKIMELSCDFHDSKRSGELYSAVEQGSSVVDLLEVFLITLGPLVVDMLLACVYFYFLLDTYLVLLGIAVLVAFSGVTMYFTTRQTILRRKSNALWRKKYQVLYDTMGGWRTVSYFNRIAYAERLYETSSDVYQKFLRRSMNSWYIGFALQALIINAGGFSAQLFAAYQIIVGNQTVGTFVTLVTYWNRFTAQLPVLASMHRSIFRNLVDAEELLKLFKTLPTVKDGPNELCIHGGQVTFDHVQFSYEGGKENVKDLSFSANSGQTIALIGETGAGKSTILKLLFRFYDVVSGSITIDGQDIRSVTLASLREHIGVVPQDPSLFNDTIIANVRFAKLDATDEEVKRACRAAAIHDKILTFKHGYKTKVGEHGVKLSGGEMQRIAIARAILKDPSIILLDEATSSVDSETESQIQQGLQTLCKGRTTFVVAHRLSTIMDADHILVIDNGTIAEQGTPRELLASKGRYHRLWTKQMGVTISSVSDDDSGNTSGISTPQKRGKGSSPLDPKKDVKLSDHSSHPGASTSVRKIAAAFGSDGQIENGSGETRAQSAVRSRPTETKTDETSVERSASVGKRTFRPEAPAFVPQAERQNSDPSTSVIAADQTALQSRSLDDTRGAVQSTEQSVDPSSEHSTDQTGKGE